MVVEAFKPCLPAMPGVYILPLPFIIHSTIPTGPCSLYSQVLVEEGRKGSEEGLILSPDRGEEEEGEEEGERGRGYPTMPQQGGGRGRERKAYLWRGVTSHGGSHSIPFDHCYFIVPSILKLFLSLFHF